MLRGLKITSTPVSKAFLNTGYFSSNATTSGGWSILAMSVCDGVQESSVSDCVNQNLTLWETLKEKTTVSSPP